ncbi:MAG: TPM domain-containing protein [Dysgonamonadaceae bacterium]|jgi:uncharacterized protein|nr:TPM domain-containing protein [Dysgonamonadaceae bacterium]
MKTIRNLLILIGLFTEIVSAAAQTYTVKTVPNDHLQNASDYVTNPDGIISFDTEQQLNELIRATEDSVSVEIAVVLLNSVGDEDIDDFGTDLFMSWGIGKKNDNGLLFLLVFDQRQMIFRTGYGVEGVLPDVFLARIIRNDMSPLMKEGRFDEAILNGMTKVQSYLLNPETVKEILYQDELKRQQEYRSTMKDIGRFYLGLSGVIFICFLLFYYSKLKGSNSNFHKYESLIESRGAVIGFTVFFPALMILFAILYFITVNRLRNKPIACSRCGHAMHKLSETEEDAYLTPAEQTEEEVHSKDYDVWLCSNCGNEEILGYDKRSVYSACPNCHAKTYYLAQDRVVKQATSYSRGKGEKVYDCKNCRYQHIAPYVIPMIVVASSGEGGRSSGSFGGGGFSGGSWGGGSTGGGGARGGW